MSSAIDPSMVSEELRKRVLVLVLAMDSEPWRMIENEGQRKTWAADRHPDVSVYWLYGKTGLASTAARYVQRAVLSYAPDPVFRAYSRATGSFFASLPVKTRGDRVETGVPETYLNTNPKNIAALRHLLATEDFDYVFRTNTSSYVNLSMLEDYVQTLPLTSYYGGFIGERDGVRFASGTCTLLSRDSVEYIVSDPAWEFGLIDDVAMGRSMARAGIEVEPLNRIDVLRPEDVKALIPDMLSETFVVRCKSENERGHDVQAMHRVHQLYTEAGTVR